MFQSLSFLVGVSPPDMYSVIYHSLISFRVTALFGPGAGDTWTVVHAITGTERHKQNVI